MNEAGRINVSLEQLLGRKLYDRFSEGVILPQLLALAETKSKDPAFNRFVQQLQATSPKILAEQAYNIGRITLNQLESDGKLIEVHYGEPLKTSAFIKQFSARESFPKALDNQRALYTAVQGSEFQNAIPEVNWYDNRKKIIVTPFFDRKTAKDLLPKEKEQKVNFLKEILSDYIQLSTHLNKQSISLPNATNDFADFFAQKYLEGDITQPLYSLFKTNIGDDLAKAQRSIILGDPHLDNLLIGEDPQIVYIDFPKASSNGLVVMDIYEILRKANIDATTEKILLEHVANEMAVDSEEFTKLYAKNAIAQQLITTKRYLSWVAADEDKLPYAHVMYTSALKRIDQEIKRGNIDQDLADKLRENPPTAGNHIAQELNSEEYNTNLITHNPFQTTSQEYINPNSPQASVQENKQAIKLTFENVKRKRRSKLFKKIMATAATVAIIGLSAHNYHQNQIILQKEAHGKELLKTKKLYNQFIAELEYRYLFETAIENGAHAITQGAQPLGLNDEQFYKKVADSTGIPAKMLKSIVQTNFIQAGYVSFLKEDGTSTSMPGVNIFDPIAATEYKGKKITSPRENMFFGANRLAQLIKECEDDSLLALEQFYSPFTDTRWIYGRASNETITYVKEHIGQLAYASFDPENGKSFDNWQKLSIPVNEVYGHLSHPNKTRLIDPTDKIIKNKK